MNIASLKQVSTPRELETLAPLDEIREVVEREITPLQVHAGSYDEMYQVIAKLQTHWDDFQRDAYFKNENSRYIYALVYMDAKERNAVIGLDSSFYYDTKKTKDWYRKVAGKVHPDHNPENQEDAKKAYENLNDIYETIQWAATGVKKAEGA